MLQKVYNRTPPPVTFSEVVMGIPGKIFGGYGGYGGILEEPLYGDQHPRVFPDDVP